MFITSTLRSYGALKILNDWGYRHLVPTGRMRLVPTGRMRLASRRPLSAGRQPLSAGRQPLSALVAITTALSFLAMLVPVAGASLTKSSTMACCVGKAGHCDSGIAAKKVPPPKSEPMCGLHGAEMESDGITIVAQPVAEPSHSESHHSHSQTAETNSSQPAAESASSSQPCHMDCASCAATATPQQKRDRNLLQPTTDQTASSTTSSFDEGQTLLFSSNDEWEHVTPRGPPSDLR